MTDRWLLDRLVCPATRTTLRHDPATRELVSDTAEVAYPIRDGIPVLLIEAGRGIAPVPTGRMQEPLTLPD